VPKGCVYRARWCPCLSQTLDIHPTNRSARVYERTIWQGACNCSLVVVRPSRTAPLPTQRLYSLAMPRSTIRLIAPTAEGATVLDAGKLIFVAEPDLDLSKQKLRKVTRTGMRKTPEYTCDALEQALTQYFGEHWTGCCCCVKARFARLVCYVAA